MSKYFNADTFFETFGELNTEPYNNFPTADVVEVIRCEDCIYYHPSYCEVWSKFGTVQTREHGFCYMGERREDGTA